MSDSAKSKTTRRMGKDTAARTAFLDAADRLLVREGYTSLIARRVAEEAGQTKQLLYYYFPSIEQLVCEAYERSIAKFDRKLDKALKDPKPIAVVWKLMTEGDGRRIGEFLALANRSDTFRDSFATRSSRHYKKIAQRLGGELGNSILSQHGLTPDLLAFFIVSASRNKIMERELSMLECETDLDALFANLDDVLDKARNAAT